MDGIDIRNHALREATTYMMQEMAGAPRGQTSTDLVSLLPTCLLICDVQSPTC
jgi:hypothetical protein